VQGPQHPSPWAQVSRCATSATTARHTAARRAIRLATWLAVPKSSQASVYVSEMWLPTCCGGGTAPCVMRRPTHYVVLKHAPLTAAVLQQGRPAVRHRASERPSCGRAATSVRPLM
jgi:hypothetical protein